MKKKLRKIKFRRWVCGPYDTFPDGIQAVDNKNRVIYIYEGDTLNGKPISEIEPEDITSFDGWRKNAISENPFYSYGGRLGKWLLWRDEKRDVFDFVDPNDTYTVWTAKMYV